MSIKIWRIGERILNWGWDISRWDAKFKIILINFSEGFKNVMSDLSNKL